MKNFTKVIVLGFIVGAILIPSINAQSKKNLQDMYMDYLRAEGYVPSVDKDGDILFKVAGDSYYILVDEDDLQFFQIYMGINLGKTKLADALHAANYATRRSKVAKVYISQDGKSAIIKIELLVNKPEDFKQLFSRSMSIMRTAEENFLSELK